MAESIEDRVATLERRVSDWEGQMGFLVPVVKQLHRETIVINEKVDRLDGKVDAGFAATLQQFQYVGVQFTQIQGDIADLKAGLDALPRAIAEIITKK